MLGTDENVQLKYPLGNSGGHLLFARHSEGQGILFLESDLGGEQVIPMSSALISLTYIPKIKKNILESFASSQRLLFDAMNFMDIKMFNILSIIGVSVKNLKSIPYFAIYIYLIWGDRFFQYLMKSCDEYGDIFVRFYGQSIKSIKVLWRKLNWL